jgi:hypothetical protein
MAVNPLRSRFAKPRCGKDNRFVTEINAVGPDPTPSLQKLAHDAPATMIMVSSIATLAGLRDLKNVHVEKRERDQQAADAWDKFLTAVASVAQESGFKLADSQTE